MYGLTIVVIIIMDIEVIMGIIIIVIEVIAMALTGIHGGSL